MKKYTKRNTEFWFGDRIRIWIGVAYLALMFVLVIGGMRKQNQAPLISPIAGIVQPVEAKEPSVVISCEDPVGYIRCKFYKHELTEKQAIMLIAIAKAESNLKPRARNPHSTARGLFQIIASTWYNYDCIGDKYDFKDNTECAIKIMNRSGYTPWEVYNTGSYKKHLTGIEI